MKWLGPAAAGMIAGLLAIPAQAQDVAAGERLFKRHCGICHIAEKDSTRRLQGPNLWGLIGRKAGTIEGFRYSEANKNSGIVWSTETLDPYLADPRGVIRGTTMAFVGVKKPDERKAIIEFLDAQK
ncbi:MAG: cytochrome c family protein [Alphaproteobacteria bacterium]|nr:cytochrome c family protein [Alphaproteobacteria bacterium]MCW5741486.1 cytochrome c family protein [Alphaproteobacteria bacterium]